VPWHAVAFREENFSRKGAKPQRSEDRESFAAHVKRWFSDKNEINFAISFWRPVFFASLRLCVRYRDAGQQMLLQSIRRCDPMVHLFSYEL
jgi:hypothetical protein